MKFMKRLRLTIRYKSRRMKINTKQKACRHGVMSKELIFKMIGNDIIKIIKYLFFSMED